MRKPFPWKPMLVFAGVVAAVRLSRSLPEGAFLSPSFLAAGLFLYAPLPWYRNRGFPSWAVTIHPGRSIAYFVLLSAAGAAVFLVLVRLPLPPEIAPYRGTFPLTAATAVHQLLLVALPEEVFFRGYLHDVFAESGRDPVIPVSLLFALGHVAISPSLFRAFTFFPGILLGWGRMKSGNVFVPTAVHFLFNLFPFLFGGPT